MKPGQATTLLTPGDIKSLETIREKAGRYVKAPTIAEIRWRHEQMRGWYVPRDQLIKKFMDMVRLKSPFPYDRSGIEAGATVTPEGDIVWDVDPFPFDVTTLAGSILAGKHPYVNAIPGKGQKRENVVDFERFMQAVLDMRMAQNDFLMLAAKQLMATGWLVTQFPYNPQRAKQGKFPFEIRTLYPIGVYPMLNEDKEVVWCTYERRITGADLLDQYGDFPTVRELLEDEPGERDLTKPGTCLETSVFRYIRYYDDTYTSFLLDASDVTEGAAIRNPTLRRMRDMSKQGKHWGIFSGTDTKEDYLLGEHHLGRIPMDVQFCWEEGSDRTYMDPESDWIGRVVGLPFLYSQRENWIVLSRIRSMLDTMLIKHANPPIFTTVAEGTVNLESGTIYGTQGDEFKYVPPPPLSQDQIMFWNNIKDSISQATFTPAAFGMKAGASGKQQADMQDQGDIRLDKVVRAIERSLENTLYGIACCIQERKIDGTEDDFNLIGKNDRYGDYIPEYPFKKLDAVPYMQVELLNKKSFLDPARIAMAKSASGLLPDKVIYAKILELPNPEEVMAEVKEEVIAKEQNMLGLDIQKAYLEKQVKMIPEMTKLQWQQQQEQDKADLWKQQKQMELDMSQIPEEVQLQMAQATKDQIMQQAQQRIQQQLMAMQPQPPAPAGTIPGNMPPSMPPMGMGNGGNSAPLPMGGMGGGSPLPPPPGGGFANGAFPAVTAQLGGPVDLTGIPTLQNGPRPLNMPQPLYSGAPRIRPNIIAGIQPGTATAPGQAQQPIQPLSRMQPPGGIGRPGVGPMMVGPQQGMPGTPQSMPQIMAANRAVAPIEGVAPPTTSAATAKHNAHRGGTRRGKRGKR